ncbi:MAG: imidazole glycerol phosphate synthase subunit HisH [Methanosarcinales archaeon Met12]|nr:MAG: imidazole glycerol phosphate synthase subunit HisH [Methanosarcinales archaeon Met12]
MKKIIIIDYGLGNLRSVQKGLQCAGADIIISKKPSQIKQAGGLVLPGVGAFKSAMNEIKNIQDAIYGAVADGTPLLGICLGMQILLTESEEGGMIKGLDTIPGKAVRFAHKGLKVPHMGWNSLKIKKDHQFVEGVPNGSYAYFVHSYYAVTDLQYMLATSDYGREFPAIMMKDNVIGTQFHPEKSGDVGLRMLENFVGMC